MYSFIEIVKVYGLYYGKHVAQRESAYSIVTAKNSRKAQIVHVLQLQL